jgi:hypothetical protein
MSVSDGVRDDDSAEAEPTVLVAVTSTRITEPTSPTTGRYVDVVCPPMSTQPAPTALQRSH